MGYEMDLLEQRIKGREEMRKEMEAENAKLKAELLKYKNAYLATQKNKSTSTFSR